MTTKKVTCTRPNASEEISGIKFEKQEDGSVTAFGLSPKDAEQFQDFPGYTVEDDPKDAKAKPAKVTKEAPAA
jgi:hypothetical protein